MPLRTAYKTLLDSGRIAVDPAQEMVLDKLYLLYEALEHYNAAQRRFLPLLKKTPLPQGMYIYGDVGRGKSMLMDLFFSAAPLKKKRRVHFHAFMLEVHAKLHLWRQENRYSDSKYNDPIPPLAKAIAHHCQLLCFDEFQVTDIADAMILGRLFQELFKQKVIIVATSNRPPADLYKDGLQRERFLAFIALLMSHVEVVELAALCDYRLAQLQSFQTLYHTPLGEQADRFIDESFAAITRHAPPETVVFTIQGRKLVAHKVSDKTAVFSFAELCEKPLGAADYIALSERFSTIILSDIPKLQAHNRNEAKRFVTLIDSLYERHVKLLCSAETLPQDLYTEGTGAFEFQRTVSRLMEMQSERYMALPHGV